MGRHSSAARAWEARGTLAARSLHPNHAYACTPLLHAVLPPPATSAQALAKAITFYEAQRRCARIPCLQCQARRGSTPACGCGAQPTHHLSCLPALCVYAAAVRCPGISAYTGAATRCSPIWLWGGECCRGVVRHAGCACVQASCLCSTAGENTPLKARWCCLHAGQNGPTLWPAAQAVLFSFLHLPLQLL